MSSAISAFPKLYQLGLETAIFFSGVLGFVDTECWNLRVSASSRKSKAALKRVDSSSSRLSCGIWEFEQLRQA